MTRVVVAFYPHSPRSWGREEGGEEGVKVDVVGRWKRGVCGECGEELMDERLEVRVALPVLVEALHAVGGRVDVADDPLQLRVT